MPSPRFHMVSRRAACIIVGRARRAGVCLPRKQGVQDMQKRRVCGIVTLAATAALSLCPVQPIRVQAWEGRRPPQAVTAGGETAALQDAVRAAIAAIRPAGGPADAGQDGTGLPAATALTDALRAVKGQT